MPKTKSLYKPDGEDADYSKYRTIYGNNLHTANRWLKLEFNSKIMAGTFARILDNLRLSPHKEATVHHELDDLILWVEYSDSIRYSISLDSIINKQK